MHSPLVFAPVHAHARFLVFDVDFGVDPRRTLLALRNGLAMTNAVVGIGEPLARALGATVHGLRTFPAMSGPGCVAPSTQGALWVCLAADDRSELHDTVVDLRTLAKGFVLREDIASFRYREGRDLTGYEDGTENPRDDAALAAALIGGRGDGEDGGTFVAIQRWVHDLERFARHTPIERDHVMGRRREDNVEISDAPASAHVKRAAQESFDPPAFMLRRSMPFSDRGEQGLYFVAYGASLDRFERVLYRMMGLEDGIADGLFSFSHPITGGYYFCPPILESRLDLRAIGL